MDYSILITRINSETEIDDFFNVFADAQNPGVYYAFGIIDFLQKYTFGK